jgi:hypothetical protein
MSVIDLACLKSICVGCSVVKRAPCNTTSGTRTSNTRYVTPSCHLTGSRISGCDWWLGPAVHQAKQGFASLPDRAENDFSHCASSRASGSAAHRKRQVKGWLGPAVLDRLLLGGQTKPRLVTEPSATLAGRALQRVNDATVAGRAACHSSRSTASVGAASRIAVKRSMNASFASMAALIEASSGS